MDKQNICDCCEIKGLLHSVCGIANFCNECFQDFIKMHGIRLEVKNYILTSRSTAELNKRYPRSDFNKNEITTDFTEQEKIKIADTEKEIKERFPIGHNAGKSTSEFL